jgi:serine/threonine protein kinase
MESPGAIVGCTLGRYRILQQVGAGGMGVVYRARDEHLARDVAIKVLPPGTLIDQSARKRFHKEALVLSQLNHPNVATIHDFDTQQGVDFLVMEYIPGTTLSEKLAGRPLPEKDVLRLGVQLAEGLATAHECGVVHRDLKPGNLRITSDGRLKILDFGLAKLRLPGAANAATESFSETAMSGTLPYMAPEQLLGGEIDARTDIHAAGSVLYEMATGQHTFAGVEGSQLIGAILHSQPVAATSLNPKLSPELERIIGKCLEKEPENRYQSASELAIDLRRLAAPGRPTTVVRKKERHTRSPNQLVERQFLLTERLCRKLDRTTLDPRIIGDHLHYVDNQVRSDVLVFFLHGLGLDHRDFEPILKRLRYRGVSPTLYGCEPDRHERLSLSLADHVSILREWLKDVTHHSQASTIVMVGFSLGADMGFELLLVPPEEPPPRIDAFLSLECNLSLDTCFVSRVLATIASDKPDMSLVDLRRFGDTAASFDEWLNINEYLVKVLRKFQGNIGVLQRAAADIVHLFSDKPGFAVFTRWLSGARERVPVLRLVFSDSSSTRATLSRLKLENLDSGILGGEFPEREIAVWPHTDHFDLMATDRVLRQVDELVAEIRNRPQ